MKKLIVTTVIGIYLCLSDVSASELTIVDKSITKTIKNWGQL